MCGNKLNNKRFKPVKLNKNLICNYSNVPDDLCESIFPWVSHQISRALIFYKVFQHIFAYNFIAHPFFYMKVVVKRSKINFIMRHALLKHWVELRKKDEFFHKFKPLSMENNVL